MTELVALDSERQVAASEQENNSLIAGEHYHNTPTDSALQAIGLLNYNIVMLLKNQADMSSNIGNL